MSEDKGFSQELFNRWLLDKHESNLKTDFDHLARDSIVVDLGAYKGQWAKEIYEEHDCRPFCFEPVFHDQIKGFQVHPYALGKEDGKQTIMLDNDGSSLMRSSEGSESIEVDVKNVITVFDDFGFGAQIDLLKLNIEGSEYDVLESLLEWKDFKNIHSILVQFHRFPEGYNERRDAIREKLLKTHYQVWCYDYIWERWDRREE